MRRWGIVVAAWIVVYVGLVSVFGAVGSQVGRLRPNTQELSQDPYEGVERARPNETGGRITGPNEPPMIVGEPNEIRARVGKFEGLGAALQDVEGKGQTEEREWTEMELENRVELVRAVRAQMREELMLLRTLALEEKAEKTAAAIDGVLLSRQTRFTQAVQKIQEEEARIAAREEQQQRATTRTGRSVGRRGTQDQMAGQGQSQDDQTTTRSRSTRRRR